MDVDVSKLAPAELASHLGNPRGEVRLAVGEFMNRVNMKLSEDAYRRLDLQSGDHVLEVGVGNGLFIDSLLKLAPHTRYTGVDISETMLTEAAKANPSLVENGRVSLKLASVDDMPLDDASVDRAVTVNCIYFWPDPASALKEIRRVLKPAGCLVVAATGNGCDISALQTGARLSNLRRASSGENASRSGLRVGVRRIL
jgi:ubiquinone/menaquinone biosynthesis C-methylase UbiE